MVKTGFKSLLAVQCTDKKEKFPNKINYFLFDSKEISIHEHPKGGREGWKENLNGYTGLALADRQFVISERISQMTKGNVTVFVNLTKALKRLKVPECSRN